MSDSQEVHASSLSYPTPFGRGWIPADRDIGLPDDDLSSSRTLHEQRRRGGGSSHEAKLEAESPHPNPSPEGEGLDAFGAAVSTTPNHNTWTPARKAAFLHHLAETGNVRASAARVGLTHQSGYLARRRDRVFRAGWDAALVLAREVAAQALATRALDGTPEAVWFKGEQVGTKVRYDGRLLLAHLARLDKAAEETEAGELAERFDELVARVAGEEPAEELADLGTWDSPAPLVPVAREVWAYRAAPRRAEEAREQWRADMRAKKATKADEPTERLTPWFDDALAEWDAWHARACAAVDAAVSAESLPVPTMTFPKVEIDMAAFYAADDEDDLNEEELEERRARYETAYTQDDVVIEYKSMELGLRGSSRRPGLDPGPVSPPHDLASGHERGSGLLRGGGVAEPDLGQAGVDGETGVAEWAGLWFQDTGNCGNLPDGQSSDQRDLWASPSLRATLQPSDLVRLVAGQRPGAAGERPLARSRPLKARASASAKLHAERQVIESETAGSGPLRTKCGAMTGT
jgi:hypothetical protein